MEKINDKEYAKEEKWIEEIREKTLTLKFCGKDYILKLKEAQVTQNKSEEIAKSNQICIFTPKKYSRKWKYRNN